MDIFAPLRMHILRELAEFASNPKEREFLLDITSPSVEGKVSVGVALTEVTWGGSSGGGHNGSGCGRLGVVCVNNHDFIVLANFNVSIGHVLVGQCGVYILANDQIAKFVKIPLLCSLAP